MGKAKFTDKSKIFTAMASRAIDGVLASMAMDIEILAKVKKVPVGETSNLQASIVHKKVGPLHYQVNAGDPLSQSYARAQEFGKGKIKSGKVIIFRNYTKPGTGAHYLRDSGDTVKKIADVYFASKLKGIKV